MKDRLRKIERVVEVQRQLKRLSEWKLALLRRDEIGLRKAQEDLIGRLNDGAVHHGLFVGSMARRLTRLAQESEEVRAKSEALQERVRDEALRLKRTERLARDVARESEADDEKVGLERILEARKAGGGDSLA
ncbi:MAG: hypothetical protein ACOYJQ_10165 [Pseudochelatococcus sp.]|jgi:hypothetical protein|uniref:hypothetical protein n=1 Tax=Pseudochelatococcus sp. TaxID=2020869 RepID=UPI003D8BD8C1